MKLLALLFIPVLAFAHGGDGNHDHPTYDTAVGGGTPSSSGGTPVISVGGSAPASDAPADVPAAAAVPTLKQATKTSDKLIIPPSRKGSGKNLPETGPPRSPASTKKLSDVLRKAAEDRKKK